jgi:hypothetical protein
MNKQREREREKRRTRQNNKRINNKTNKTNKRIKSKGKAGMMRRIINRISSKMPHRIPVTNNIATNPATNNLATNPATNNFVNNFVIKQPPTIRSNVNKFDPSPHLLYPVDSKEPMYVDEITFDGVRYATKQIVEPEVAVRFVDALLQDMQRNNPSNIIFIARLFGRKIRLLLVLVCLYVLCRKKHIFNVELDCSRQIHKALEIYGLTPEEIDDIIKRILPNAKIVEEKEKDGNKMYNIMFQGELMGQVETEQVGTEPIEMDQIVN